MKEGPGELHGIPKVVFNSRLAVEARRDCGKVCEKVVCACLIHPSHDGNIDVSSNRTREMVVHSLRA